MFVTFIFSFLIKMIYLFSLACSPLNVYSSINKAQKINKIKVAVCIIFYFILVISALKLRETLQNNRPKCVFVMKNKDKLGTITN